MDSFYTNKGLRPGVSRPGRFDYRSDLQRGTDELTEQTVNLKAQADRMDAVQRIEELRKKKGDSQTS